METSLRSFSNLQERLHHSFWFYILILPGKCIQLSVYIVPVILLSVALVLEGLKYWCKSNGAPIDSRPPGKESILDSETTQRLNNYLNRYAERYYVMPQGYTRFDREDRAFFVPILVWTSVHAAVLAIQQVAIQLVW